MKTLLIMTAAPLLSMSGCAGHNATVQQLADIQSARRSATELGAENNPEAQLQLKLVDEQVQAAKAAIEDNEDEVATSLLTRAKADAELAIAMTRKEDAAHKASQAVNQSNAQRSANREQGGQ